jgi:hypothetical protein
MVEMHKNKVSVVTSDNYRSVRFTLELSSVGLTRAWRKTKRPDIRREGQVALKRRDLSVGLRT